MPIILPSLRYPAALFSRRIFRDFDRLRASSKGKGAKPQIPNRVRTAPASGSRASTPSRPLVRRVSWYCATTALASRMAWTGVTGTSPSRTGQFSDRTFSAQP